MSSWQDVYRKLTGFIAAHKREIVIRPDSVNIPPHLSEEFYRLLDEVNSTFINEKHGMLLKEAEALSDNFLALQNELGTKLKLMKTPPIDGEGVFTMPAVRLRAALFNNLLDLLKGNFDIAEFERQSSQAAIMLIISRYKASYEKWIALSLINMVAPDKIFNVPFAEESCKISVRITDPTEYGKDTARVLAPVEFAKMSFYHIRQTFPVLGPDFIIHSGKLEKYFSFRTDVETVPLIAETLTQKREWLPLEPLRDKSGFDPLKPGLLIYEDADVEALSVVADFRFFARPDIIIEGMSPLEWQQGEMLSKIMRQHEFLKPKCGTYIVSRMSPVKQDYKDLLGCQENPGADTRPYSRDTMSILKDKLEKLGVHILTAEFNADSLKPIVKAMK
jgi:hypothetical protein